MNIIDIVAWYSTDVDINDYPEIDQASRIQSDRRIYLEFGDVKELPGLLLTEIAERQNRAGASAIGFLEILAEGTPSSHGPLTMETAEAFSQSFLVALHSFLVPSGGSEIFLSGCNTGLVGGRYDKSIAQALSEFLPGISVYGAKGYIDGAHITRNECVFCSSTQNISSMLCCYKGGEALLAKKQCVNVCSQGMHWGSQWPQCWNRFFQAVMPMRSQNDVSLVQILIDGKTNDVSDKDKKKDIYNFIQKVTSRQDFLISKIRAGADARILIYFHGAESPDVYEIIGSGGSLRQRNSRRVWSLDKEDLASLESLTGLAPEDF